MTIEFDVVKPQPLSQTLLDTLREAIIAGQLKPGQPLVQSSLAQQFGVSRAPLREAMNRLEEEGFVRSVPYKGTTVAPLTLRDVEETRSLRNLVEESAGKLVIDRSNSEDVHEIETAYVRLVDASVRGDVLAVDTEDMALHALICELSGHSLLLEVWNRYSNRFRWVLTFCNRVNMDLVSIAERHEPLIQAFRDRDHEALHDSYRNHMTDLVPYLPVESSVYQLTEDDLV